MGRELLDWNKAAYKERWKIAHQFALWATRCAVNEQGPGKQFPKCREAVNGYLDVVAFDQLFDKTLDSIGSDEFDEWHTQQVNKLCECHENINVGWAAKMIAIYLKTTCYLSGFGRDGLNEVIHPPLDTRLLKELGNRLGKKVKSDSVQSVRSLSESVTKMSISSIDWPIYENLIKCC